jgi:predicted nucleic acid-binding protein
VAVARFLDTNIVLYAASARAEDDGKRLISLEIISEGGFATSAQVHQEFYNVATRKNEPNMSHREAVEWLDDLARFQVVPITRELVVRGGEFAERYKLSYWDGAIIAAAHAAGAEIIFSEDLNDGQRYGAVRVINPFPGYAPEEVSQ